MFWFKCHLASCNVMPMFVPVIIYKTLFLMNLKL